MSGEIEDFIGVFNGVVSGEFCKDVISSFEKAVELGFGFDRVASEDAPRTKKDDLQVFDREFWGDASIETELGSIKEKYTHEFNRVFWDCYAEYADKYQVLSDLSQHTIYNTKLQRTDIGQGYHIWHCEHEKGAMSRRLLAFVLYLNDVAEGGETEFLYQHKRFKPEAGTLVIFPASFTHTHRGNPPISNSKYILTGWVEF